MQEVNEMWAGLGYYRRARFLLEVRVVLGFDLMPFGVFIWMVENTLLLFML